MSSEEASPTPDNFQPKPAEDATRDLLLDLAAVSRMKNTAPPDVSVNLMVEELGRRIGGELTRRVLDRPHTYLESIPAARAAATRPGRESDENRSAEDGGE